MILYSIAGKGTAKNCDACFEFIVNSMKGDYVKEVGATKILEYLTQSGFTFEEKMRAVVEACSPKLVKAMREKGVSKQKLMKSTHYPNGYIYQCPWNVKDYPKTMDAALQIISDTVGPILEAIGK